MRVKQTQRRWYTTSALYRCIAWFDFVLFQAQSITTNGGSMNDSSSGGGSKSNNNEKLCSRTSCVRMLSKHTNTCIHWISMEWICGICCWEYRLQQQQQRSHALPLLTVVCTRVSERLYVYWAPVSIASFPFSTQIFMYIMQHAWNHHISFHGALSPVLAVFWAIR